MGSSPHVYIGPYLRCVNGKVDAVETHHGCTQCRREETDDALFCNRCGGPCGPFTYPTQRDRVDAFDVSEKIKERLHFYENGDQDVWMPNVDVPTIDRETTPDGGVVVPITDDMLTAETLAFRQFFEKEFRVIGQEYGAANVQIQFGVVYYDW